MGLNFNTSISGMMAAQKGINIVSMNAANLNTDGYVRQVSVQAENNSGSGEGIAAKIGSGVTTVEIKRTTDSILQDGYNKQNSKVGYYDEVSTVLSEIELVLGDDVTGTLSKTMDEFFASWEELSKFPEESAYRNALVGETVELTQKINEMAGELDRIKNEVLDNTDNHLNTINTALVNLGEVNKQINQAGNHVPNSLLNERDRLITELSSYITIDVNYESGHPEAASIRSGGVYLLDNERTYDINLVNGSNGYYLTNGNAKLNISSGKLKADLELVDNYINAYQDELDTFASVLVTKVNALHNPGYSVNGDTGVDFFIGSNSRTIGINDAIKKDPSIIATTTTLGADGNTDVAKDISALINSQVTPSLDFRNYANSFSMKIAQDINNANTQTTIQTQVLNGLGDRKSSTEGVNLNEEMINMVMYQKTFAANSKAIQMIRDTLDTIIELI